MSAKEKCISRNGSDARGIRKRYADIRATYLHRLACVQCFCNLVAQHFRDYPAEKAPLRRNHQSNVRNIVRDAILDRFSHCQFGSGHNRTHVFNEKPRRLRWHGVRCRMVFGVDSPRRTFNTGCRDKEYAVYRGEGKALCPRRSDRVRCQVRSRNSKNRQEQQPTTALGRTAHDRARRTSRARASCKKHKPTLNCHLTSHGRHGSFEVKQPFKQPSRMPNVVIHAEYQPIDHRNNASGIHEHFCPLGKRFVCDHAAHGRAPERGRAASRRAVVAQGGGRDGAQGRPWRPLPPLHVYSDKSTLNQRASSSGKQGGGVSSVRS